MASVYTPNSAGHVDTWRPGAIAALVGVSAWGVAVAGAAGLGWLADVPPVAIGAIVTTGVAAPTLLYLFWPPMRAFVDALGLRTLTAFHGWRIGAALLFFWYGGQGQLPTLFVLLAGGGDLVAGAVAVWAAAGPQRRWRYWFAHAFGLADFAVAVGAGLTLALLHDTQMAAISQLPLALVPYFGVALSGATHLMAFRMLWRRA